MSGVHEIPVKLHMWSNCTDDPLGFAFTKLNQIEERDVGSLIDVVGVITVDQGLSSVTAKKDQRQVRARREQFLIACMHGGRGNLPDSCDCVVRVLGPLRPRRRLWVRHGVAMCSPTQVRLPDVILYFRSRSGTSKSWMKLEPASA